MDAVLTLPPTTASTAPSAPSRPTMSPPTAPCCPPPRGRPGAPAWLPSDADMAFVASLMQPVYEPGRIASWVAPPRQGINGHPFAYEYVHLA
ncbi:hypothetical protein ACU686_31080 [Yinghuangia aomiensis]